MSQYRLTARAHRIIRGTADALILASIGVTTWLLFTTLLAWFA